ncbi:MAG: PfkB family carbohydrate kinase [Actinomycetes bacterium]
MIRTVTFNSGFDDCFDVTAIRWGQVDRVRRFESKPSGKGVNLGRVARWLGAPVCAYSLVGEPDEMEFARSLRSEGIDHVLRTVPGATRHNLTLYSEAVASAASHAVGPGFVIDDHAPVDELMACVVDQTRSGDIVTLNGSLPTGLSSDTWARLASSVRDRGGQVVLDLQGEPLVAALDSGVVLAAKPNEDEALVLPSVGVDVGRWAQIEHALNDLVDYGVRLPMITMGAEGVAFAIDSVGYHAQCPVDHPKVVVGAGDAFLAGVVTALHSSPEELTEAVSAGLAAAAAYVGGASGPELASDSRRLQSLVECTRRPSLPD